MVTKEEIKTTLKCSTGEAAQIARIVARGYRDGLRGKWAHRDFDGDSDWLVDRALDIEHAEFSAGVQPGTVRSLYEDAHAAGLLERGGGFAVGSA